MPTLQQAKTEHAAYYCRVGHEANNLYQEGGKNLTKGLEMFDAERVHIEDAGEFLISLTSCIINELTIEQGKHASLGETKHSVVELLISFVDSVSYLINLRFHPRLRIRWLGAQLAAACTLKNQGAEGRAVGNLGIAHRQIGDADKALAFQEQRLAIARENGDRHGEGLALGNIGLAHWSLGAFSVAIDFHNQALVVMRELNDKRETECILGNLGNAYSDLKDFHKAIDTYAEALKIDREIGDRRGEGTDLGNLGLAYAELGKYQQAISHYEEALTIAQEIGNLRGEGNALLNSALVFYALGDQKQFVDRAEAALKILEDLMDPNAAIVRAQLSRLRNNP